MERRRFLKTSAAGGASLLLYSCDRAEPNPGNGFADAHPPRKDAGADASCAATADNIEGPFYRPGAPNRAILVTPEMPGVRLSLSGRVVDSLSCGSLAGAVIDIWQADNEGAYDNDGFDYRGVLTSASDGSYQVSTIVPGRYLNGATYRPAHIHVKVSAPGYQLLTTQLYFENDPYNDGDPWVRESLVLSLADGDGAMSGIKLAAFDFAITPE